MSQSPEGSYQAYSVLAGTVVEVPPPARVRCMLSDITDVVSRETIDFFKAHSPDNVTVHIDAVPVVFRLSRKERKARNEEIAGTSVAIYPNTYLASQIGKDLVALVSKVPAGVLTTISAALPMSNGLKSRVVE